jgi:hypothetical protein
MDGNLNYNPSTGRLSATELSGLFDGSTGTFSGAVNIDATTDSTSSTSGALIVDGGVGIAKNVYIGAGLSVAGTLTYEDVTNVDSVGLITAKSGVNISGGQLTVGSGITMGIAGVATFSGTADIHLHDNVKLNVGDAGASDLSIYHDGSYPTIKSSGAGVDLKIISNGNFVVQTADGDNVLRGVKDSYVDIYYNNSKKFETTNEGIEVTGFTSTTAGMGVTGGLFEGSFIKAGKLSDNQTLGISTANVFYFTTQETTTATPNIVWNDSYSLSSKMAVGDVASVTVITTAAAGGYSANWTIDGNAVTEEWVGGAAPSAGGSDGLDIYSLTIIKTGTGTGDSGFKVIGNLSNAT